MTGSKKILTLSKNKADLCASLQDTIVSILTSKLVKASNDTGIKEIGIAGGVSANSGLRDSVRAEAKRENGSFSFRKLDIRQIMPQ